MEKWTNTSRSLALKAIDDRVSCEHSLRNSNILRDSDDLDSSTNRVFRTARFLKPCLVYVAPMFLERARASP